MFKIYNFISISPQYYPKEYYKAVMTKKYWKRKRRKIKEKYWYDPIINMIIHEYMETKYIYINTDY